VYSCYIITKLYYYYYILLLTLHMSTYNIYIYIYLYNIYVCVCVCLPVQVVTIAVYTFFLACLMGRQFVDNDPNVPDVYFPVFTFLEYLFYMGWLKVSHRVYVNYVNIRSHASAHSTYVRTVSCPSLNESLDCYTTLTSRV